MPPAPLDPGKTMLLPAILDLKAAGPLVDELITMRGSDLTVDGAAVQRIGAQCLQVMLAARRTWEGDGSKFSIVAASEPLRSTVALLGATAALFDPSESRP